MLAGRITRRAQQRAAGRSSALSSASGSLSQAPTPLATSSISTPSSNPDDDIISDDTQSITSFASAGQRRSRHPDDIGDSDAIRDSAERRSKEVIKRYGTLQAQRCAISEDVMNDFTDLTTPLMLVNIKANLLALEKRLSAAQDVSLLDRSDVKVVLAQQVQRVLMNPNLRAYVTGTADAIMKALVKTPSAFGIPNSLITDKVSKNKVSKRLKSLLTQRRSYVRQTLERDYTRAHPAHPEITPPAFTNIFVLTSSLLIRGSTPTSSQLARVALLRKLYRRWKEGPPNETPEVETEAGQADGNEDPISEDGVTTSGAAGAASEEEAVDDANSGSFWVFVDLQLEAIRAACEQNYSTKEARDQAFTEEMHVVLQEDLTAYSTPDGQQPIASASFTFEASDWTEVVNESTGTSAPEEF